MRPYQVCWLAAPDLSDNPYEKLQSLNSSAPESLLRHQKRAKSQPVGKIDFCDLKTSPAATLGLAPQTHAKLPHFRAFKLDSDAGRKVFGGK